MWIFRDVLAESLTNKGSFIPRDGYMDMREKCTVDMEAQDILEGLFLVEMERMDVIMSVKVFASVESLIG